MYAVDSTTAFKPLSSIVASSLLTFSGRSSRSGLPGSRTESILAATSARNASRAPKARFFILLESMSAVLEVEVVAERAVHGEPLLPLGIKLVGVSHARAYPENCGGAVVHVVGHVERDTGLTLLRTL